MRSHYTNRGYSLTEGFSLIEIVVYAGLLSILLVSFIGYIGVINDKNFRLLNEIQDKLHE